MAVVLVSCALVTSLTTTASAEPTTAERRQVAEEVATTVCRAVPKIAKLPPSQDPAQVCRAVIVENIDPEGSNSGVRAACAAMLTGIAQPAVKFCVNTIDRILDPARQLFLDKVVPAVEQLACVASTPAAFDCLAQQVHVWLKQSITSLWQGLVAATTADTVAIGLLDGWQNRGLVSLYSDIGALGALLLLGVVLTSLLVSVLLFDFRRFGNVLLGIVAWGLFWSGGATLAVLLLKASDAAARWLAGAPDASGETDLTRAGTTFGLWVDYISGVARSLPSGVRPVYDPGSFTAILICLLLIIAIVVTVIALLMRNVALLLLIMLLPLTLAGTAGPKLSRGWFHAALRLFVAFLLAKPLIVIAIRLGAVLVSVPQDGEPQATFTDALLGVTIILVAGLLPGVIYRFSGGLLQTSAGAPPRAQSGVTAQSAQSVQSSLDITRMIMDRNAPTPLYAAGGSAAATRATAGAGGLGAAAGPLGLVAVAGAMAGGALESGGRWMAGQTATGGGVVGDVEAPPVPSPPISRAAHLPSRTGNTPDQSGTNGQGGPGSATVITIHQTSGPEPARPDLPAPGSPLIIPGTVIPDRAEEPPTPPNAWPPGGGEKS